VPAASHKEVSHVAVITRHQPSIYIADCRRDAQGDQQPATRSIMTSYLEIELNRPGRSDALVRLVRAWSTRDPIDAANDAATLHDVLTTKRPLAGRIVDDPSTSRQLSSAIGAWLERPAGDAHADAADFLKIMNGWAADALSAFIGPLARTPQHHSTL
jgi:hypothetical protein